MARVTGIGGVFFQSQGDSAALAAWYQEHLGLPRADFGGSILFWSEDARADGGLTVWHLADHDSEWFRPSRAPFMINYRVDDLEEMLTDLRAAGVEVVQGPESHPNGDFAWILDPEGNKVELWQPKAMEGAGGDEG